MGGPAIAATIARHATNSEPLRRIIRSERAFGGRAGAAGVRWRCGAQLFHGQDGERFADFGPHGNAGPVGALEFCKGGGGGGEFAGGRAALGQEQPATRAGERGGVFEKLAEFGDGAGGDEGGGIAEGAACGFFGAGGDDANVWELEFGGHAFEQAGALAEWLDEGDGGIGLDDGKNQTGEPAAAANIDDGLERGAQVPGDAEQFEAFGVLAANCLGGGNGGNAGVCGGLLDDRGVALEKRQPAPGGSECREEGGEGIPCEDHWRNRGAFTGSMVQW